MIKINTILSFFNIRLEKISKNQKLLDVLNNLIRQLEINLIFDVGANEGQFAKKILKNGYQNKIISFEPLDKPYDKLNSKSSKYKNWIAEKLSLGNENKVSEINISNYSLSSSILPITEKHLKAKKNSEYISKQKTVIKKLDTYISEQNIRVTNAFLKIDTQGYEYNVLEGSLQNLKDFKIILCELSFEELYLGQKLWAETISFMEKNNFEVWFLEKGFQSQENGKMLQADCIFVNKLFKNNILL